MLFSAALTGLVAAQALLAPGAQAFLVPTELDDGIYLYHEGTKQFTPMNGTALENSNLVLALAALSDAHPEHAAAGNDTATAGNHTSAAGNHTATAGNNNTTPGTSKKIALPLDKRQEKWREYNWHWPESTERMPKRLHCFADKSIPIDAFDEVSLKLTTHCDPKDVVFRSAHLVVKTPRAVAYMCNYGGANPCRAFEASWVWQQLRTWCPTLWGYYDDRLNAKSYGVQPHGEKVCQGRVQ